MLEKEEAWLKDREAWLQDREARLKKVEARLKQARAESATGRLPAEFPRIAPRVASQQLGGLVQLKRFEVPTQALEDVERHVRELRDVFRWPDDEIAIPDLVVAATAGAGKTTLLRYLQQTADTVRYGAELQSDTNWLARSWSAPRSRVRRSLKDATQSVPALRHVFVGFATFKQGSDTSFDPSTDTKNMIERRCAWRILHDAGLARKWTPSSGVDFTQAAKMLRAQISAVKRCPPNKVAIVFLIDDVTNIPEGPRRVLLNAIAAWQQGDLTGRYLSFFIVAGLSFFEVGDQWCKGSRPTAAPELLPLVALPRELAAEVAKDAHLDRSRKLELLGYIDAAGGHPRTLERIVGAMNDPHHKIALPVPTNAEQLACVWDVFAGSIAAGHTYSVDRLATAPEHERYRRLLNLNCLRQRPQRYDLSSIALSAAPSALFLAEDPVWTQQRLSGAAFPSVDAVFAVRGLMQATGDVVGKWGLAFAGAMHLKAQCVMHVRCEEDGLPWVTGEQEEKRGLVLFEHLVFGAIFGCRCADLRYVVRDAFAHTVDRALTRADFQKLRAVSCLHIQAPSHAAIESAFAAKCGDKAVVVAAQHKFDGDATERQVDEWFDAAAEVMKDHTNVGEFRVLLCVTGLSPEALDSIKTRAANKDDRLSRAIIIDPASASQFFERSGLWTFVEALK
jgi:hypothetical protein